MQAASALFRLLGDEARLRLLRVLARERFNVTELTGILGLAQSGVSRHLGLLKDAGLVSEERDGAYSYYRLAPAVHASADKYRLGHISKQGSALLRWVLGQAAPLATRGDAQLKRVYFAVLRRRGRPKAKVALARRLLIRLYVMLRDQIDYDEFCRRGGAQRPGLETARVPV